MARWVVGRERERFTVFEEVDGGFFLFLTSSPSCVSQLLTGLVVLCLAFPLIRGDNMGVPYLLLPRLWTRDFAGLFVCVCVNRDYLLIPSRNLFDYFLVHQNSIVDLGCDDDGDDTH